MSRKVSFVAAVLFVVVALVAAGCGGSQSVLQRVEKSGVLRVGFEGTYPPFNFVNDQKQYDGFDVDISTELAKRLGVRPEFVATKWDGLIGGLQADKFDIIIAQMSITDERKKAVDFTDPYVVTGAVLICRQDDNRFHQLSDIKGTKVGVGAGTTFEHLARSVPGADVHTYEAFNDYLQDLMNGRLDVIINDSLLAGYTIKHGNLPVKICSDLLDTDTIGMAIKKGNTDFVNKVDQILAQMKQDGTYDQIYEKWFGTKPLGG